MRSLLDSMTALMKMLREPEVKPSEPDKKTSNPTISIYAVKHPAKTAQTGVKFFFEKKENEKGTTSSSLGISCGTYMFLCSGLQ